MSPQATTAAIVRVNPDAVPIALAVFGEERLALLKEQIGRGWKEPMTDTELEHIAEVCRRTRLDPLSVPRQIHFVKRWDKNLSKEVIVAMTGIDGLRLNAQRSRQYGGATPYLFCGPDGVWKEFWDDDTPPVAAKCGVKRKGWTDWLYATATFKEWAQYGTDGKLTSFWRTKPAHMLGKTAEAIALKRAFPEETNDLELAAIDAEWREESAQQARRYGEIFGSEETGTAFDIGPQRALNTGGDIVDTATGEVVQERSAPTHADLWQENRRLVEEARKRKIEGRVLNAQSGGDVVAEANAELAERIRLFDADNAEAARQRAQEGLL